MPTHISLTAAFEGRAERVADAISWRDPSPDQFSIEATGGGISKAICCVDLEYGHCRNHQSLEDPHGCDGVRTA